MADEKQIRDPILRIYAAEFVNRLHENARYILYDIYNAKKSLLNKPQIPGGEKDVAQGRFYDANRAVSTINHIPITAFLERPVSTVSELNLHFSEIQSVTEYFQESRRYFQRHTSVDSSLAHARYLTVGLTEEITILSEAVGGNETAKKAIYDKFLGQRLEQLDAPYLFDVTDYVVNLLAPPATEKTSSALEALALLTKQAADLAERLSQTNIDRRFVTAVHEYIGALSEPEFSPIKVDLFSNRLRSYLVEMREEIPGFAIAEISALLLSQDRVLRQFPVWRSFESDAASFQPNEESRAKQQQFLEEVAAETRTAKGVASNDVLEAFERLEEAAEKPIEKSTSEFGVWRSAENYVKTNIKYIIDAIKNLQTQPTATQVRYVGYLRKILPHLKLYAAMNNNLVWLIPVIHWIEEAIKEIK